MPLSARHRLVLGLSGACLLWAAGAWAVIPGRRMLDFLLDPVALRFLVVELWREPDWPFLLHGVVLVALPAAYFGMARLVPAASSSALSGTLGLARSACIAAARRFSTLLLASILLAVVQAMFVVPSGSWLAELARAARLPTATAPVAALLAVAFYLAALAYAFAGALLDILRVAFHWRSSGRQ